jgi:putative hydrolase of the HAD superfamily
MHEQLRHAGLDTLIDSAVFSAEVGWRKPSPRLFTAALARLGTSAAHTVFVGDRMREDIIGAARAGMRTVLVARDQPAARLEQQGGPDAVITSLSELPALLLAGAVVTIVGAEN